jgi:hypothetical protein
LQGIYQGKEGKPSSLARISYGAQELTVFLLADSPPIFKNIPVSESKQAFAFANYHNREERGEEVNMMSIFDDADVISKYPLEQAIKDGVLVAVLKHLWPELSSGKPIVATAHLAHDISLVGLMEIWNAFVHWRKHVMPTLPEAERLFHTTMNGQTVWVIEDGAAVTLMYPDDY